MSKYINFMNEEVDLDDQDFLDDIVIDIGGACVCISEISLAELRGLCRERLGYALLYTKHRFEDAETIYADQIPHIDKLCKEYWNQWNKNESHKYWCQFYYRITDEIENLC